MPQPIQYDASHMNLSPRFFNSVVVAASPSAAVETTIATLTLSGDLAIVQAVYLFGWAAFTVGTNGTAVRLRIRQTDTSGTIKADTGAVTGGVAAAGLLEHVAA